MKLSEIPRLTLYTWCIKISLFIGVWIAFFYTKVHVITASHDSVTLLSNILEKQHLFHPHHIIFNWMASHAVRFMTWLQLPIDPHVMVTVLNISFGSLAVVLIFDYLYQHLSLSAGWAMLLSLLPAVCFGWWFYSTSIEVYMLSLLANRWVFRSVIDRSIDIRQCVIIGGLLALSVLAHITNVLMAAVVIAAMIWRKDALDISRITAIAISMSIAASSVLIVYGSVIYYVIDISSLDHFKQWMFSITAQVRYWNSPLEITTYIKLLYSLGRTFIGGHFMFHEAFEWMVGNLHDRHWLLNDAYLVRRMNALTAWILVITGGLMATLFAFFTILLIKGRYIIWNHLPSRLLLVWGGVFSLFFLVWNTENLEFWIQQSMIMMILFVTVTVTRFPSFKPLLLVVLIGLFGINYVGSMVFLADKNNDYYHVQARQMLSEYRPGDVILLPSKWQHAPMIAYVASGNPEIRLKSIEDLFEGSASSFELFHAIETLIETAHMQGHYVIVPYDTIHLHPTLLEKYALNTEDMPRFFAGYIDRSISVGEETASLVIR